MRSTHFATIAAILALGAAAVPVSAIAVAQKSSAGSVANAGLRG